MANDFAIGVFTVHYNSGNHEAHKPEYVVRNLLRSPCMSKILSAASLATLVLLAGCKTGYNRTYTIGESAAL